ncbi:MAG: branched-chain amino acid ABC transporter permease [Solirubrobacteraceae bacterium]|jgi:neutral amino acid transport system permease protein
MLQTLVFGLITGSILAIAATGFALIRQTEGFLNIAHGQFLLVGAYLGVEFTSKLGLGIVLAGLVTFVCVGALAVLCARLVFDPVRERGALVLLFTSIGLAYVLYAGSILVFGVDILSFDVDFGNAIMLGSVAITPMEIGMIGVFVVAILGLMLFFNRTRLGTWVRATASNPDLARVRGVPVGVVSASVWFVAGGLGGVAGILLGLNSSVTSELGWNATMLILAATVLGGLGRIYGVMAAAMFLGLVMNLATEVIDPSYSTLVAFGALIIVLLIRPEGIFSIERRREIAA